jgi:hypothetical protein
MLLCSFTDSQSVKGTILISTVSSMHTHWLVVLLYFY